MLKSKQQFPVLILRIFLFVGAILPVTAFAQNDEASPLNRQDAISDVPFSFWAKMPVGTPPSVMAFQDTTYFAGLGIKWLKTIWLNWQKGEPQAGQYDFTLMDYYQTIIENTGVSHIFTISPHRQFDPDGDGDTGGYSVNNGELPQGGELQSYLDWVEIYVERYKNIVHFWQIVNELSAGHFPDSASNYAELLYQTSQVIYSVDSTAKVILASPSMYLIDKDDRRSYLADVFRYLDTNYLGERCFDITELHYIGWGDPYPEYCGELVEHTQWFLDTLQTFGYENLPMTLETITYGGGVPENPQLPPASQREQAIMLMQKMWLGAGLGYDLIFHNHGIVQVPPPQIGGGNTGDDLEGLIYHPDINGTVGLEKKLSYFAYKMGVTKINGYHESQTSMLSQGENDIFAYRFMVDNHSLYVLWSNSQDNPQLYSLEGLDVNSAVLTQSIPTADSGIFITHFDSAFVIDTVVVNNGALELSLTNEPVYVELIQTTAVAEVVDNHFNLYQNYPNPFNPQTTISYQLPVCSKVTLKIYDSQGQEVQTLVNENKSAGNHSVVWNGKDNSGQQQNSDVYFYSLELDNKYSLAKRMLLLKW